MKGASDLRFGIWEGSGGWGKDFDVKQSGMKARRYEMNLRERASLSHCLRCFPHFFSLP